MAQIHRLQTLSPSTERYTIISSSKHGLSQHIFPTSVRRFPPVKTKGRANLRVVAVEETHLETKVTNLTLDMAQAMTDVATVTSDMGNLQKDVTRLSADLARLAGSVEMLRASGDRLDNHISRYLESYEKYNERHRKPFVFLIITVLALDLVLEAFLLVDFLKTCISSGEMRVVAMCASWRATRITTSATENRSSLL